MTEQRKLQRWHLIYYLRVFDQDTETLLGHVVDINTDGIMLVTEKPIPKGKDFRLWIELPLKNGKRERISFDAHSLWSNKDINPDFYDTGFRLVNLSPIVMLTIQGLINDLMF